MKVTLLIVPLALSACMETACGAPASGGAGTIKYGIVFDAGSSVRATTRTARV